MRFFNFAGRPIEAVDAEAATLLADTVAVAIILARLLNGRTLRAVDTRETSLAQTLALVAQTTVRALVGALAGLGAVVTFKAREAVAVSTDADTLANSAAGGALLELMAGLTAVAGQAVALATDADTTTSLAALGADLQTAAVSSSVAGQAVALAAQANTTALLAARGTLVSLSTVMAGEAREAVALGLEADTLAILAASGAGLGHRAVGTAIPGEAVADTGNALAVVAAIDAGLANGAIRAREAGVAATLALRANALAFNALGVAGLARRKRAKVTALELIAGSTLPAEVAQAAAISLAHTMTGAVLGAVDLLAAVLIEEARVADATTIIAADTVAGAVSGAAAVGTIFAVVVLVTVAQTKRVVVRSGNKVSGNLKASAATVARAPVGANELLGAVEHAPAVGTSTRIVVELAMAVAGRVKRAVVASVGAVAVAALVDTLAVARALIGAHG